MGLSENVLHGTGEENFDQGLKFVCGVSNPVAVEECRVSKHQLG